MDCCDVWCVQGSLNRSSAHCTRIILLWHAGSREMCSHEPVKHRTEAQDPRDQVPVICMSGQHNGYFTASHCCSAWMHSDCLMLEVKLEKNTIIVWFLSCFMLEVKAGRHVWSHSGIKLMTVLHMVVSATRRRCVSLIPVEGNLGSTCRIRLLLSGAAAAHRPPG